MKKTLTLYSIQDSAVVSRVLVRFLESDQYQTSTGYDHSVTRLESSLFDRRLLLAERLDNGLVLLLDGGEHLGRAAHLAAAELLGDRVRRLIEVRQPEVLADALEGMRSQDSVLGVARRERLLELGEAVVLEELAGEALDERLAHEPVEHAVVVGADLLVRIANVHGCDSLVRIKCMCERRMPRQFLFALRLLQP